MDALHTNDEGSTPHSESAPLKDKISPLQPQPASPCAQRFWDKVIGQDEPLVTLQRALATGTLSHAYLFVGAQGLGKINAARAVATQLMCPQADKGGGCGKCAICTRLARNAHPDFRILEPQGAQGYLIDQIRTLNHEAILTPVEAPYKVYVLRDVDLFNKESANAFLKTLEEPSPSTVFILLAHTLEPVLPTIVSRCQVLRFRPLTPERAYLLLEEKTGAQLQAVRVALAASGGQLSAARDYLASPKQQEARALALRIFRDLRACDDLDVLDLAAKLQRSALEPVNEMRAQQEADLQTRKELLDTVAIKELERYNKRRLSAFEQHALALLLNVFSSLLRDALCLAEAGGGAQREQDGLARIANIDAIALLQEINDARPLTPVAAAQAQASVDCARRRLAHNVGSRLLLEALLFDIREVLL